MKRLVKYLANFPERRPSKNGSSVAREAVFVYPYVGHSFRNDLQHNLAHGWLWGACRIAFCNACSPPNRVDSLEVDAGGDELLFYYIHPFERQAFIGETTLCIVRVANQQYLQLGIGF